MKGIVFAGSILGLMSGILCRSFLLLGWPIIGFVFLLGMLGLLAARQYRRLSYLVLAVVLIGASLGMARMQVTERAPPTTYEARIGTSVTIVGKVMNDPDIRELSQRVVVETEDRTRILAVLPLFPELHLGEQVTVEGTLERPAPFDTDSGRVFRYDQYLAKDGVFLLMPRAHATVTGARTGLIDGARGVLADLKHHFMDGIEQALPEPSASLASGMLLGGKQGLGQELLDAFTATGLVHIVVLSGYNIMIIAEAVLRGFGFLRKRIALSLSALTIVAFVIAAGAGSAALRAGIMAVLALVARATGRTYDVLRALGVAVAAMLLLNPLLLAFDPGFQLSVIATLGLILGTPLIEARMSFVRPILLREVLATTLAAQIAVLPLLLYQTGNLSLISLPANALVLPFVPLAMLLSFGASVVAIVVPVAGPLLGLPAYVALSYVIGITEFMAQLPFATVVVPAFPFTLVVLLYVLLVGGVWYLTGRSNSS